MIPRVSAVAKPQLKFHRFSGAGQKAEDVKNRRERRAVDARTTHGDGRTDGRMNGRTDGQTDDVDGGKLAEAPRR